MPQGEKSLSASRTSTREQSKMPKNYTRLASPCQISPGDERQQRARTHCLDVGMPMWGGVWKKGEEDGEEDVDDAADATGAWMHAATAYLQ